MLNKYKALDHVETVKIAIEKLIESKELMIYAKGAKLPIYSTLH